MGAGGAAAADEAVPAPSDALGVAGPRHRPTHLRPAGRPWVGLVMALASASTFGTSGPVAKAVIGAGFTPLATVWLRLLGASLILFPLAVVWRPAAVAVLVRRRGRHVLGYGLLSLAGVQVCFFIAVSRLPVGVALLLEYLAPAVLLTWLVLVRRRRVPGGAVGGAVLAVAGIAVVVQVWQGIRLDPVGLVAGLTAAACLASYFLLSDHLTGHVDPVALVAVGTVVGVVAVTGPAAPWRMPWRRFGDAAPIAGTALPVGVLLLWLVVVSTVVAYVLGVAAVRSLTAPVAGVVATVEVVFAAVAAWLMLGERLTGVQLAGGLLVIGGAVLAQRPLTRTVVDVAPGPHG